MMKHRSLLTTIALSALTLSLVLFVASSPPAWAADKKIGGGDMPLSGEKPAHPGGAAHPAKLGAGKMDCDALFRAIIRNLKRQGEIIEEIQKIEQSRADCVQIHTCDTTSYDNDIAQKWKERKKLEKKLRDLRKQWTRCKKKRKKRGTSNGSAAHPGKPAVIKAHRKHGKKINKNQPKPAPVGKGGVGKGRGVSGPGGGGGKYSALDLESIIWDLASAFDKTPCPKCENLSPHIARARLI